MQVSEAMNRNVKTIRPDQTVREAAELMNRHHIGSLLVISGVGTIAGIVTERDILSDVVAEGNSSDSVKVEEIMTKEVITINPEASLEDAAAVMTKYKIKKLPVLQKDRIVGIITASDLITYEEKLIERLSELLLMKKESGMGG